MSLVMEIVGFVVLVIIALVIVSLLGFFIMLVPAAIVALIVWFLSGSGFLAGLAFLVIAALSFTRRAAPR